MKFYFFRPTSRLHVTRPVAITMNTLNMLGPGLMLCALLLIMFAQFGDHPDELHQWFLRHAIILVVLALGIRIAWGIVIRFMVSRYRKLNPDESKK